MSDNGFPGPMTMIRIDGLKVKQLREQQGLTQLYLATAVDVTTDTISRWENRRYPSIKKENGLKLAEALNVSLEELLEEEGKDISEKSKQGDPGKIINASKARSFSMIWPLLLLSFTLFSVLLAFLYYSRSTSHVPPFGASRTLPPHCISGQPFPVVIAVSVSAETAAALIIKETIPEGATLHATSPKVSSNNIKNRQIKWLKKVSQPTVFAYTVSVSGKDGSEAIFTGTAANSSDMSAVTQGDTSIVIGTYHWADTNKDNVISDNEILTVYDLYSDIVDIDLDIDLIEEIWLGSGYRWNRNTAKFEIIE